MDVGRHRLAARRPPSLVLCALRRRRLGRRRRASSTSARACSVARASSRARPGTTARASGPRSRRRRGRPCSGSPSRSSSRSCSRSRSTGRRRAPRRLPADGRLADAADHRARAAGRDLVRLRPTPKVVLVALFTFFSIAVGLVQGLASADHDAMSLLRTMGASRAPAARARAAAERDPAVLHGPEDRGDLLVRVGDRGRVRRRAAGPRRLHDDEQERVPDGSRVRRRARRPPPDAGPVRDRHAAERLAMPWRRPAEVDARW